ncbi:MAG: coenzyme F420 hydrogenase subunit alpha [Methanobacteriaceae archaeon]|nr:coenzyme F420 hydrogenase subunit alpha [Methanobacteriaceae archaeon]
MIYINETIVVSPVTRQSGAAELSMEVNEEGIVTTGRYFSFTPIRGLEKMVIGRAPETAPLFMQRICATDSLTHTLASVEAIEQSLKINISKTSHILRELCLHSSIVNSHLTHQLFIMRKFISEKEFLKTVKDICEIRKNIQYIQDTIGGEGIHPPDIRIGGMDHNITKSTINKIKTRIKNIQKLTQDHVEYMITCFKNKEFPDELGMHNQPILTTSNHYGNSNNFLVDKYEEMMPTTWFDQIEISKISCSNIPLYDGKCVETGPRARADKFRKFKDKGLIAQHISRAMEINSSIEHIIELINKLDPSATVHTRYSTEGTDKMGLGVIEGSTGTEVHMVKVNSYGKIDYYNVITPTTWNIPTIGIATEGFHYKYGADIVRGYNPCSHCATHMLVIDDSTKKVLKDETKLVNKQ